MMGVRGPAPKRSDQRRRTNEPAAGPAVKVDAGAPFRPRAANRKWHPIARQWYEALGKSGQSAFYVASDWALAYAIAESMSREYKPRPVTLGKGEFAETVLMDLPVSASALQSWLKGASMLLCTEGDRRRVAIELQRPKPAESDAINVDDLDDARRRLAAAG